MLYKNLIVLAITIVVLGSIMTSTSPDDFSAPLLVLVFGLVYILIVILVALVLQILVRLKVIDFNLQKIVKVAATGSMLPVFMLLLHSIGQLTSRDIFLASAFFVLLYFYYGRITKKPRA